jgi:hypothetical protein
MRCQACNCVGVDVAEADAAAELFDSGTTLCTECAYSLRQHADAAENAAERELLQIGTRAIQPPKA